MAAVTTQSLVTYLKDNYAPNFGRTAILDFIDQVQVALFCQDAAQMTWLNSADDSFPIPILQTTAGTLEYEISAANLLDTDGNAVTLSWGGYTVTPRKVKCVFIQSAGLANYSKSFTGERFDWAGINTLWTKRLNKLRFYEVPQVPSVKTNLRACRIQFGEDPGTTSDMYYVEFYVAPVTLTSESIPLSVDGDRWRPAFVDGVMSIIEDIKYGTTDRWAKFEKKWKPDFRRAMNAGMSQRKPLQMPIRECG